MKYLVMTHLAPEDVVSRAKRFFADHARVGVREPEAGTISFSGDIGSVTIRLDREHGHTNVRVVTDRVAGLDITDLTKRFLYTLEHV